jgi:DNA modification methylase
VPKYLNLLDPKGEAVTDQAGALTEKFGAPPFSVFDARSGWWQARKAAWIALGIQSELGRGENLLHFSDTVLEPDPKKRAAANRIASFRGQDKLGRIMRDKKKGPTAIPGGGGLGKNSAYLLKTAEGYKSVKELQERRITPGQGRLGTGTGSAYASMEGRKQTARLKGGLTHGITIDAYGGAGTKTDTAASASGTSIFDPVLCELFYRWFVPKGGLILDPYAGGSVRGIVAGRLGYNYVGIDLRPEQIEANRQQAEKLCRGFVPEWVEGDSQNLDKLIKKPHERMDAIFSCPPYWNLEQYSDDPRDLSNLPLDEFVDVYRNTILKATTCLKSDRFAAYVVGEVRNKQGLCVCLSDITNACFEEAGLRLYNRAALITAVGSLSIRVGRIFNAARKLGTTHQEVLIYVKGDPKKAAQAVIDV